MADGLPTLGDETGLGMIAEEKYYWPGNIAKTKAISRVLRLLKQRSYLTIFDYGCGTAGDWPTLLAEFQNIRWFGYEPHKQSRHEAQERLRDLPNATVLAAHELDEASFSADVIVSFSVFEHVYDRRKYLETAHRLLSDQGIFILNYDDGHFRQYIDLSSPASWMMTLRQHLHNLAAPWVVKLGLVSSFQQRVKRDDADMLLANVGFKVESAEYSNFIGMKRLFKTLPAERHQNFIGFWLQAEEVLNRDFRTEGGRRMGDTANLWLEMVSRTLVLTHMP